MIKIKLIADGQDEENTKVVYIRYLRGVTHEDQLRLIELLKVILAVEEAKEYNRWINNIDANKEFDEMLKNKDK